MEYVVQYGDSLWTIAGKTLKDPSRWPAIATLNHLADANHLIVGQHLQLPPDAVASPPQPPVAIHSKPTPAASRQQSMEHRAAVHLPARVCWFVLADEVNPLRGKLVRKVLVPKGVTDPDLLRRIMNPERHGFEPRDPATKVTTGRHVLGMTNSKYISTSERPLGSPRFEGRRFWIDIGKVKKSGGVLHDGHAISADLDRIAAKSKDPGFKSYIEDIRAKALTVDREVLVEGSIPAAAVKGAGAMALTRGLQFVQGAGMVMSAYDLSHAAVQSYNQHSVIPIEKESIRQAGGWGGAWAGAEFGAFAGGAVGIETGPGAIITGAVGAFIFGIGGFLGADWVANRIGSHDH